MELDRVLKAVEREEKGTRTSSQHPVEQKELEKTSGANMSFYLHVSIKDQSSRVLRIKCFRRGLITAGCQARDRGRLRSSMRSIINY